LSTYIISQALIDLLNIGGQNYIKNSGYFIDLPGWSLSLGNAGDGSISIILAARKDGHIFFVGIGKMISVL
jgi:hypothetical protein